LFVNFRNIAEVLILMGTLPFAVIGAVWLMFFQGFNFSIAVGVGFIALIGVSVEIGVIMLLYLNQSWQRAVDGQDGIIMAKQQQVEAVLQGAGLRVRPVMMTSLTVAIGLLPILFGSGTGSEVMSRVAAPMVGGMVTAVILTLLVLPAAFLIWKRSLSHHE